MSRPPPQIITQHTDNSKYYTTYILKADAVWAVYYNNKPINIKTLNSISFSVPKYTKVSFSNAGHAINLAKKLNKQFDTNKFTVVKLSHGDTVFSE